MNLSLTCAYGYILPTSIRFFFLSKVLFEPNWSVNRRELCILFYSSRVTQLCLFDFHYLDYYFTTFLFCSRRLCAFLSQLVFAEVLHHSHWTNKWLQFFKSHAWPKNEAFEVAYWRTKISWTSCVCTCLPAEPCESTKECLSEVNLGVCWHYPRLLLMIIFNFLSQSLTRYILYSLENLTVNTLLKMKLIKIIISSLYISLTFSSWMVGRICEMS